MSHTILRLRVSKTKSFSMLCLIFIPKIRFERERRLNMSRRNIVAVSGLMTASTIPGKEATWLGRTSHSSGDDDSSTCFGERILTTKTQKELAEENAMLRRLLDRERKKNDTIEETNNKDLNHSKPFSGPSEDGSLPEYIVQNKDDIPGVVELENGGSDTVLPTERSQNAEEAFASRQTTGDA